MLKFITSSMLNMFFRCPEQFRRRYLEGEIIPPGIAAAIGKSVHKAAEENHKHKLLKEEDLPKDYLQDFARDTYVKIVENEGVYLAPEELDQAISDNDTKNTLFTVFLAILFLSLVFLWIELTEAVRAIVSPKAYAIKQILKCIK